ncbi:MAG: MerR family transcriptional regulator [Gammaproteobacteria bacterium]
MRIGHLAQELGIRPSRIRYYEEAGLLAPPARISGRRHYGQETVDRLRLILAAQQATFTLAEIRELVSLLRANNPPNQGWSQLATAKLERLDATISRLQSAQRTLAYAIDCTCGGVAGDCKLVGSTESVANDGNF